MTVNSLNKATIDGSPAALLYPFEPTNIQEILGRSISRKSFQVLMLTRFNKNKVKQWTTRPDYILLNESWLFSDNG